MERVACFKTRDGKVFEQERDAAKHELCLEFRQWYEKNKIYGKHEGCQIEGKEIESWIIENARELRVFLDALP